MSRTVRRQTGEQHWKKLTPRYVEHVDGVRLAVVCINWHEIREYENKKWYLSWRKKKPEHKYAVRWTWARFFPITLPCEPAEDTLRNKLRNECDWSRGSAKAKYKESVNVSDRACRKQQLHKVMLSARGNLSEIDFDDVHEYDPSYENTVQRNLIWCIF